VAWDIGLPRRGGRYQYQARGRRTALENRAEVSVGPPGEDDEGGLEDVLGVDAIAEDPPTGP
jgi:hypothetical protein